MREQYLELISKIERTRSKELNINLLTGIATSLSLTITLLTLFTLLELIIEGGITFRTTLYYTFWISLESIFAFSLFKPVKHLFKKDSFITIDNLALKIGSYYNDLSDKLSNALQNYTYVQNPRGTSSDLALADFNNIYSIAKEKNFDEIIENKKLKRATLFLILAFITFAIPFYGFTNFRNAFNRLQDYSRSYLPPAPFKLIIETTNTTALRGSDVTIKIKGEGIPPEKITFYIKDKTQNKYDSFTLKLDSNNSYYYTINSIKNSKDFYAYAEWLAESENSSLGVTTQVAHINVIEKPLIKSLSGNLISPNYSKIPSKPFTEQNADLIGLRGSSANIKIESTKDLDSAFICFKSGKLLDSNKADTSQFTINKVPIKVQGKEAFASIRLTQNQSYYILLKDKEGLFSENPIEYKIGVLEDSYPTINQITPTKDAKLNENALLPIKVNITDDYGFASLKLHYRLVKSSYAQAEKNFKHIEIAINKSEIAQEIPYLWDLKTLNISPEDEYEFYLEVFDNDNITGPKSTKTDILKVRLPSLDEVMNFAEEKQKEIQKNMEQVLKEAEKIKKDIDELNKELKKDKFKDKADWDDKKKAENILKKQEELANKMQELQKQLSEVKQDLQENNLLSKETLDKMQELQEMMKQVATPEMMKQSQEFQQKMEQMTPQQMQKALEKFKMSDEQFRQRIERTMKLMEKMKLDQKADALQKQAENLSKQQEELKQESKKSNSKEQNKENAQKQENLKRELNKLNDNLKEFEKDFNKFNDNKNQSKKDNKQAELNKKMMENLRKQLNKEQTEKKMQEASEKMEKGDNDEAEQPQQEAKENLDKFSQEMKKTKREMNKTAKKEAIKKMQKSMQDLYEISKQQEQLRNQTKETDSRSSQVPEMARKQNQIKEALKNLAQSLTEQSQKSQAVKPEMMDKLSEASQDMEQSTDALSERQMPQSGQEQSEALSKLNQAMGDMQSSMAQMQGKGKGGKQKGKNKGQGGKGEDGENGDEEGDGEGEGEGGDNPGMSLDQRLQQAAAEQQQIMQSMQKMMQRGAGGKDGQMGSEERAEYKRLQQQQDKVKKSIDELNKEQNKFTGTDKKKQEELNKLSDQLKELVNDIQSGKSPNDLQKKQEKILNRLLDATRSDNERDFDQKREAQSGKDYSSGASSFNENLKQKNFQDLLKSLKLNYSKDYENLIKKYFDSLNSK
jgi:hypothetical protein